LKKILIVKTVSNLIVFFWFFEHPVCFIALQLATGESAVIDEHFELFTVSETPKIAEIQNFQNFDTISFSLII